MRLRARTAITRRCAVALTAALCVLLGTTAAAPAHAFPAHAFPAHASPAHASERLPSEKQWRHQVSVAMKGSRPYLDSVLGSPDVTLAVVLDIDNTSLATHYRPGSPVLAVRAFARAAIRNGGAVLFDTGRLESHLRHARKLLKKAGFPITAMCGRHQGESLDESKPRCREQFSSEGYDIIANVGNNDTDFSGVVDYDRAFELPNYAGRLG